MPRIDLSLCNDALSGSREPRANSRSIAMAVKAAIQASIRRRAAAEADSIRVDVEGDRVTLEGHLSSWAALEEAEELASHTPGVSGVVDQLAIDA